MLQHSSSPLQLIEKAQTFSEDDDLLSPFDTGDVERQMKRAWWKTCSLFTFLITTLGIIIFIIIRDNNITTNGNNNNKSNNNSKVEKSGSNTITTMSTIISNSNSNSNSNSKLKAISSGLRGELPKSIAYANVGPRAVFRKLYSPKAEQCVTLMMDTFVENSEIKEETITLNHIENGFFSVLDEFSSMNMKQHSSIKEYLTKSSELGYYSSKLNIDFPLNSITVTAKSDALIFLISINWEMIFGNKLPYVTEKVVTMQYSYDDCEITNLVPNSFEECFNGKCTQKMERDSVVVSYLKQLVEARGE